MSTITEIFSFDNSYARLPREFYARIKPTPVAEPHLVRLNRSLAGHLGLDPEVLSSPEGVEVLAGNRVPETSEPIAMAYAGHQFANWVPRLGDGRAVLLGEVVDSDGARRDIQLKGAGRTPFSRMGDGRAALGPVVREYLASEAMAGLGIPTARALAVVTTGESVYRDRAEAGAILTRVARSHVRVGTFEYFHRSGNNEAVRTLADYVISRHYPWLLEPKTAENPYKALLREVTQSTADLIASWLLVGFVHGVMNTDNVSIAGETIDYGPLAFLDSYHPDTVFSSIDAWGRYAYGQQPGIGYWNLTRFAETLLPLLGETEDDAKTAAYEALHCYESRFEAAYHAGLRKKLGLAKEAEGDIDLAFDLLGRMAEQRADFTLTFRRLCDVAGDDPRSDEPVRALFHDPTSFDAWARQWRQRLALEARDDGSRSAAMRAVNPAFILRNHLAQQAVDAAANDRDFKPMDDLLTLLATPFDDHPDMADYAQPPRSDQVVAQTFCGT